MAVSTPHAELGQNLPAFELTGVDGKIYSDRQFRVSQPLVVMFICNHCPYVRAVEDRLLKLARDMSDKVSFVAICSNDAASYPDDSYENLKKRAEEKRYPFAYLHDERQDVARAFGAVCTPDYFVYDHNLKLAYRGRLDDSWQDAANVEREEMREVLKALVAHQPLTGPQYPSMGCSIKWIS